MTLRSVFILVFLAGGAFAQFTDDFNAGTSENWTPKTPDRWTAGLEHGRRAFYIHTGDYTHEAPAKLGEYALVTGRTWSDFSFSCLARSREDFPVNTAADFAVVFGYQNNSNYYYMLFNRWAGETKLFKVVSDVRTEIAAASGFRLRDNAYRIVEVRRSGIMISVYYDGVLVLTARDGTFLTGQIGVGSYNDAASFDDVRIEEPPIDFDRWIRTTPVADPVPIGLPAGGKFGPRIAVVPDGSFVLAWVNFKEIYYMGGWPYDTYQVIVQVFAQDGTPLSPAVPVNTGFSAFSPEITAKDGRFFISWEDWADSGAIIYDAGGRSRRLVGRHFSLEGLPLSDIREFAYINPFSMGWGYLAPARVVFTHENSVSAVWVGYTDLGEGAPVWPRQENYNIYSNSGWGRVNDLTDWDESQGAFNPSVAADNTGRCLVVWDQIGGIYAQAFAADGGRIGSNLHVNPSQVQSAGGNNVASNRSGQALIVWSLGGSAYAQRANTSGTLVGGIVNLMDNASPISASVNRRGDAGVLAATDAPNIRVRLMRRSGTWLTDPKSVDVDDTHIARKTVFWENCLYTVYEDPVDSTLMASVHLLDNRPRNYAPHLTSARADTAWEDVPYRYIPEGADPNGDPVTFSFADTPSWLSPEGAGLSGTPRQGDGDTSFVVISSDGALSDPARVVLTVIPVDDPPRFVSPDSVTAWTDSLFTYTARAVDEEDSVLTYTFLDYPAWMTPADSVISGIVPSGARDTSFTVIVSDGLWTDTLRVYVRIRTANRPPRIVNLSDFTFPEAEIHAILLDTCAVDDGPAALLTWTIRPENDTLSVLIQDRTAYFSSPGWVGSTLVCFRVTDPDGASDSLTVTVTVRTESGAGYAGGGLPEAYSLSPVYPNPFNAGARITFELPAPSECTLDVYNLKGERIERLFEGRREAGRHSLVWDAAAAPSGTYLIRLRAEGFVGIQKCTLIK